MTKCIYCKAIADISLSVFSVLGTKETIWVCEAHVAKALSRYHGAVLMEFD